MVGIQYLLSAPTPRFARPLRPVRLADEAPWRLLARTTGSDGCDFAADAWDLSPS